MRKIGRVYFCTPGYVLLAIFLMFLCSNNAHSGSVQPLTEKGQRVKGVHPGFSEETTGWVTPLPVEKEDIRKIIAEGWAKIYNGNVENARLAALRMAYAEAVGRVAGIEIGSLTLIRNVKQVSDVVMSRSRGFIRSYRVVREGISETDQSKYEVLIEAEVVNTKELKGDEEEGLLLYLELLGNPKLLIMLPEEGFPDDAFSKTALSESESEIEVEDDDTKIKIRKREKDRSGTLSGTLDVSPKNSDVGTTFQSAEAALARAFSMYGYQVITSDDLLAQGLIDPEVLRQAKAGITAQAVKVAKAAGADMSLLGIIRLSKSSVKPAGIPLVMVTAEASAKALIVSSGRIVHAFHRVERSSAPEQLQAYADSLDRIANGIADVLAWKIPKILTEDSRETRLAVHGIKDVALANKLRQSLIEVPGMEAVRFSKLPTKNDATAEFVLLTGFVRIAPEEILEVCEKSIGTSVSITKMNKYEIELDCCKSMTRSAL